MVVETTQQDRTDRVFHALADATRRDIVRRTLDAEHTVSGLARRYPMSFAAVQKHVAVLERAGLVTKRRRGREQWVCANAHTIQRASDVLSQLETLWRGRLDQFDQVLTEYLSEGNSP
jgi:DNA-binding transcriptional ArsR family regulator